MVAYEKPLSRLEILAIISMCGLLFIVAFRDGNLLWAIPAMNYRDGSPLRALLQTGRSFRIGCLLRARQPRILGRIRPTSLGAETHLNSEQFRSGSRIG